MGEIREKCDSLTYKKKKKTTLLTFTPVSFSVAIYDGNMNNVTRNIIGAQYPMVSWKNSSLMLVVSYGGYGIFCITRCEKGEKKNIFKMLCHKFERII